VLKAVTALKRGEITPGGDAAAINPENRKHLEGNFGGEG